MDEVKEKAKKYWYVAKLLYSAMPTKHRMLPYFISFLILAIAGYLGFTYFGTTMIGLVAIAVAIYLGLLRFGQETFMVHTGMGKAKTKEQIISNVWSSYTKNDYEAIIRQLTAIIKSDPEAARRLLTTVEAAKRVKTKEWFTSTQMISSSAMMMMAMAETLRKLAEAGKPIDRKANKPKKKGRTTADRDKETRLERERQ